MIYKKDANFPYPLLTNTSKSYDNCDFILDIDVEENINDYRFYINYELNSDFILGLLERRQAQLVLVIQSKDNKFFNLDTNEKVKEIPKSRVSLSKRTTLQLLIPANEDIFFTNNNDLSSFYDNFKEDIVVKKNSVLGFSNCVIFNGSTSKPLELFEKKVDPNLKSDVKIELTSEVIVINYKNENLQFLGVPGSEGLNNPYIYMGLQKALTRFIRRNVNDKNDEEVDIDSMEIPEDELDLKLYNLMKKKMVQELSYDNIDEVIYKISDKILERYSSAVRRLYSDGN